MATETRANYRLGTLDSLATAVLLALAIGVPMGVYTGLNPHTWLSRTFMSLSLVGVSLPTFLTVAPIVVTFGALALILVAVEIGRFLIRPPASFGRAALRVRSVRQPARNTPPGPQA